MKYDGTNLEEVLKAHEKWVLKLGSADIRNDQDYRLLSKDRADFRFANLAGVNLRGRLLFEANMANANLANADLSMAILARANLTGANLLEANLSNSSLNRAKLMFACLFGANLNGASLIYADLDQVDLRHAVLIDATLAGAQHVPFIPMTCPDSGAFIGWKKAHIANNLADDCIVKLLIPEDAKRSSAVGRKCRCDKAVVLEIQDMDGKAYDREVTAVSALNYGFIYEAGKTVTPEEPFEEDRFEECASGVHFFVNRQEAVDY